MCHKGDLAFSTFLDSIVDDYLHDTVDLARLQHTQSELFIIFFESGTFRCAEDFVCCQ
jgi:hypothetical protein